MSTIKIRKAGYSEELIIERDNQSAKVYISGNELRIEGAEFLKEIGMMVSDALAYFFDLAASQQTKSRFPTYLSRRGN